MSRERSFTVAWPEGTATVSTHSARHGKVLPAELGSVVVENDLWTLSVGVRILENVVVSFSCDGI